MGLLWNVGELSVFIWRDFGGARVSPVWLAISYSAFGFLPSVVENAIKHGISKSKNGGEVRIAAKLENEKDAVFLNLSVFDSGAGVTESELLQSRENGFGLNNIEQRLHSYYGKTASLTTESKIGKGTKAEIKFQIPDSKFQIPNSESKLKI